MGAFVEIVAIAALSVGGGGCAYIGMLVNQASSDECEERVETHPEGSGGEPRMPAAELRVYSVMYPRASAQLSVELCQTFALDFCPLALNALAVTTTHNVTCECFCVSGAADVLQLYHFDGAASRFELRADAHTVPLLAVLPPDTFQLSIVETADESRSGAQLIVASGLTGWLRFSFCPLTSTGAVADPPPTASAHRSAVPHSAQAQLEGPLAVVPLGCARSRTNAQRTRAKADDVGVLVCAAIGYAVVYSRPCFDGMSNVQKLPDSDRFNSVMCACEFDMDLDGVDELVVGTYSSSLLVYKRSLERSSSAGCQWDLRWQREMDGPIYSVCGVDVTGDGVSELVVVTAGGIHILQYDLNVVRERFRPPVPVSP